VDSGGTDKEKDAKVCVLVVENSRTLQVIMLLHSGVHVGCVLLGNARGRALRRGGKDDRRKRERKDEEMP
jgi:hypothetical protein